MRIALYSSIGAGIALMGATVIAATPVTPSLPDVESPAVALSAGATQDVDQEFLDLLQLLGPDYDNNLVSGAVDLPDLADFEGADLGGVNPEILPQNLGEELVDATVPPPVWNDVFGQSG